MIMRVLCLVLPLLVGCSSLSFGGASVGRVSDPSAVKACTPLGEIWSSPPYALPDDWEKQLRNRTAELGGDTVLADAPGLSAGKVQGRAFRCRPVN
jgi:hypothetical protein